MGLVIQKWPGGFYSASGGGKTGVLSKGPLDRWWQVEREDDPITCPFRNQPQNVLAEIPEEGGWRVIVPAGKQSSDHVVLVPNDCWSAEKQHLLGGEQNIEFVLCRMADFLASRREGEYIVAIQIGIYAAQNVRHLHWHLHRLVVADPSIPPTTYEEVAECLERYPELLILEEWGFRVSAGGKRGGQCYILPFKPYPTLGEVYTGLARVTSQVAARYCDKFRSKQGLPPDYMFRIHVNDGKVIWGELEPVLNQIGNAESVAAELGGRYTHLLPWPHEETAEYLRGTETTG